MDFMNSLRYIIVLLTLILTLICEISSQPAARRLDDNYYALYPRADAPFDTSIGNLKRGYYYIDNGYIIPVKRSDALAAIDAQKAPPAGRRRQDSDLPDGVKFTPLVRYKQTKSKRKKLFVPNFFG